MKIHTSFLSIEISIQIKISSSFSVADDKENDLMVQLDSRPAGTVSARATPRTTPSRTLRSLSPINSSLSKFPHFQILPLF